MSNGMEKMVMRTIRKIILVIVKVSCFMESADLALSEEWVGNILLPWAVSLFRVEPFMEVKAIQPFDEVMDHRDFVGIRTMLFG